MNRGKSKAADVPNPAELVEPGHDEVSRVDVFRGDESRLAIFVGKKRVAIISITDREIVKPGDAWTSDLAERLFDAARTLAATRHALRILGSRAKATEALRRQLVQRGHERLAVDRAIERLLDARLLDDETFAEHAADALVRRGGTARRAIESKLRAKGIDGATARAAANNAAQEVDERAEALRLATHRASRMDPRLDRDQKSRRLFGWLARRGFDSSDARYAVENALRDDRFDEERQHEADEA